MIFYKILESLSNYGGDRKKRTLSDVLVAVGLRVRFFGKNPNPDS